MTGPRTYGDPCGLAKALDAVGERWALLITRELAYGPRRFTDLRAALGASPNVLTQRLTELEAVGVVTRRTSGGAQYDLTERGRALHPALIALTRWGLKSPDEPTGLPSHATLLLALEAGFTSGAPDATIALHIDDDAYTMVTSRGALAITRARPPHPDGTLAIDPRLLAAALLTQGSLDNLPWRIEGDPIRIKAVLSAFV